MSSDFYNVQIKQRGGDGDWLDVPPPIAGDFFTSKEQAKKILFAHFNNETINSTKRPHTARLVHEGKVVLQLEVKHPGKAPKDVVEVPVVGL